MRKLIYTLQLHLQAASSIVNEVIRKTLNQFFFYEKILRVQKLKSNQSISSLLEVFAFVAFCLLNFIFLVGFGLICAFVHICLILEQ